MRGDTARRMRRGFRIHLRVYPERALGQRFDLVGTPLRDDGLPKRNGTLGDAERLGDGLLRFEVGDDIGLEHRSDRIAC